MHLSNVELIQSTVVDVSDPAKQGRIKCVVPGIFESTADKDSYPWIPPLGMTRYQSFSKEVCGAKVWVVQVKNNYNEFYYIPLVDQIGITKSFLEEKYESNPEIVYMRDRCGQTSSFTYDDEDGHKLTMGDYFINLRPDGELHCKGSGADVHINNDNVFIGSDEDGDYEPAIFGDKLCNMLSALRNALSSLQSACSGGQDNPALAPGFSQAVNALNDIDDLKCKKTKVN